MQEETIYISVDIEATFVQGRQRIIEIGAVKRYPNGELETFSQLICPDRFKKMQARIQQLTGITTEEVRKAPSFQSVMGRFQKWCGESSVFLAFGEFDRLLLEQEFIQHRMCSRFLFPFVDFQQKYMIEHNLKEQPALEKLMQDHELTMDTQHRALADAHSLMKIFEKVNGSHIIQHQQTSELLLVFSSLEQQDTYCEAVITWAIVDVEEDHVTIRSMQTAQENLDIHVKQIEKQVDGEQQLIQKIRVIPSETLRTVLQQIAIQMEGRVLITKAGMRSFSKLLRLHHCTLSKTETMQWRHLLKNEKDVDVLIELKHTEETLPPFIKRFEQTIIEELQKRALLKHVSHISVNT